MTSIPRPTRLPCALFVLAAALALGARPAAAQSPTPTPTPTPPPDVNTYVPATSVWYGVTEGDRYDGANLLLDPDGTFWTTSATQNSVVRVNADLTKSTKWIFPKDAGPSSLYKDADGTLWVTELGGFNVAHFDPATGNLTQWSDTARRPSSLVRAQDGTFWLPETNGLLARFDPASGKYTYFKTDKTSALSYPWLDPDGSVWTCDFYTAGILKYSPDGSQVKRWDLPSTLVQPSKVFRAADGKIWISVFVSGQLAQLDEATNVLRVYQLPAGSTPFDLANYRGRIVYSDQRLGDIGMLDPNGTKPVDVETIVPTSLTTTTTTNTVAPTTTTLTPVDKDVTPASPIPLFGTKAFGLAAFAASNGAAWGIAVDRKRERIWFATFSNIGSLQPPIAVSTNDDLYVPAAASAAGAGGSRWKTQLVLWNRGTVPVVTPTPTPAPSAKPVSVLERLYPTDWIAGYSPGNALNVPPDAIVRQDDVVGTDLNAPDSAGSVRIAIFDPTLQPLSDLFGWWRVYTTLPDGGTFGFARNAVKSSRAVTAPEQQFFFTPPDVTQRTNAGLLVLADAKGTVSVVDATGNVLGSFAFDWPGGYQWQASTIFSTLGIAPVPSGRVVFALTAGQVLPFGMSIDPGTNDPVGLDLFAPTSQALFQVIPGADNGGGPMGGFTDLQLYNAGADAVTATLTFRPAGAGAGAPAAATVSVPAHTVRTLRNVLTTTLGLGRTFGTLEIASSDTLFAFARVIAAGPLEETHFGYSLAARLPDDAILPGSRGVFISATDNGWNVIGTTLVLANPSDQAATADVVLTDAYGSPSGRRTLAVGAHETLEVPSAWYGIAGFGTDFGRIDVIPADGSAPLHAMLLRQDLKTRDADPVFPFVIPR